MEKIYKSKNGIILVEVPEVSNREDLRKVTEDFLKKVLIGGSKHGHSHTTKNLREK